MACKSSYELHHHFPKLAEESGFVFNLQRPRAHIDWHKIRSIDIESIIKDRKFYLIEQHLNDILHCGLESEFDVRILDEGVIKMFRLAQLAVEYQQFCRHYLDRSIYVLREEITSLAQELDLTKKTLHDKEEELRRVKRKTKHPYRTQTLPYGNDNIAAMIIKSLTNKSDLFPTTSNADGLQYNKCSYCDKVFLNQLYLKSHLSRRHSNMLDVPQKDTTDNIQSSFVENPKINSEIMELKSKLQEMETMLNKVNEKNSAKLPESVETTSQNEKVTEGTKEKITKDAEVSTDNEHNVLDKIEEWKKEEHEKYNKEINLLRTQIVDVVNYFKNKESENRSPTKSDTKLIEQLQITIKEQGAEIKVLKQELGKAKLLTDNEERARKLEAENQMSIWTKRLEVQTQQYEALLQKLNDAAKEARDARAQAEAERCRAAELSRLLQDMQQNTKEKSMNNNETKKKAIKRKPRKTLAPQANHKSLENLHKKAQELLNMRSSSSSDTSSSRDTKETSGQDPKDNRSVNQDNRSKYTDKRDRCPSKDISEQKKQKVKKEKSKSHLDISSKVGNGAAIAPGSPVKLVRARITEEVNNRLVTIGVDPLKSRLPKGYFQKQKLQLQQQHESKYKKNPDYQRIKHSILAYLDTTTATKNKDIAEIQDYVSPQKMTKTFSITSVISNVKSKALSLVKSNDVTNKDKRKILNAEVAKRAMSLLKTPPGSAPDSPIARKNIEEARTPLNTEKTPPLLLKTKILNGNHSTNRRKINLKKPLKSEQSTDDDETVESDHKYYNPAVVQQAKKSIDNLIKSPARRPSSANAEYNNSNRKLISKNDEANLLRSQSTTNVSDYKTEEQVKPQVSNLNNNDDSNEDTTDSSVETKFKKTQSEENIPKQTKGVLKNASSTSSLNKKKVLFDMDAIQMKSVSASPSQSITEKSENNEKFELGLINLDGDEWDISSIDNEPLKNDTKIQVNSRTSPKISELKQTIESQLARRSDTPSTAVVGGVNLLPALTKTSSIAGSNTSLGSSILDESDGIPNVNHKAFIKPKNIDRDDSEIDLSDYSLDGITKMTNKKEIDSF